METFKAKACCFFPYIVSSRPDKLALLGYYSTMLVPDITQVS
jgi:hypothetical protein